MNILLINTYFYPNIVGGTENVILGLAEEYLRLGHNVAVYSLGSPVKTLYRENIRGITVYRSNAGKINYNTPVNPVQRAQRWMSMAYNFKIPRELNTVIDEFNPDVIHTNNLYYMSTLVWKTASKRKIRVVHTTHDYFLIKPDHVFHKLMYRFNRLNAKYISCFTGPSSCIYNEFVKDGFFSGKSGYVIPNGIEMSPEILQKRKADKKRRTGNGSITFMYAGQLTEEKGISNLLEVWSRIENPDIRLVICGKGPLEEKCRSNAANDKRIGLVGFLSADELEKIYQTADVLIAPSVWKEPFGMVVLEALYHAMPVIAGNAGGMSDILEHVGCGISVDASDPKQLYGAIMQYQSRDRIQNDIDKISDELFDYTVTCQAQSFIKLYR